MDSQRSNSAGPPQNPAYGQSSEHAKPAVPGGGARNTELYEAITKEDEEIVVLPQKKRTSPFIGVVVLFMKITFYFDSIRRSNESLFRLLGGIWAGIMGLLYLSGLVTLFLSIYSYMRLPLYLESFFDERQLTYDSLKMSDFSLSQIEVVNLHDAQNLFVVPKLEISSTFADFLQKRIRSVTANGLAINLKTERQEESDNFADILKVLGLISSPSEAGFQLKIDSVTINNSFLTIKGKETNIPISFSLNGIYANDAQIVVPFTIQEPFLKLDADLTISGTPNNRTLTFRIKSGTLSIENRPPEELQGEIILTVAADEIRSAKGKLNLDYDSNLKTIEIDLSKGSSGYDGTFSFILRNILENDAKPSFDLSLGLNSVVFEGGKVKSSAPLSVKLNRLNRYPITLENIEGVLAGDLLCSISEKQCSYNLKQETAIRYQNIGIKYKDQQIVFDEAGTVKITPSNKTLVLKLEDSTVEFDADLADINLAGFYNSPNNLLTLSAKKCFANGSLSNKVNQNSLNLIIEKGNYQTTPLNMSNIHLEAEDLFDPKASISFSADEVSTNSPLLSHPLSVQLRTSYQEEKKQNETTLNLRISETDISLTAKGVLAPFQKTFSGEFYMPAVDLAKLPVALSELSPLFSDNIEDLSGEVIAIGKINFAGASNISGPMYVSLKDVSFKIADTSVQQVNSVIALRSLLPLVSANNQILAIGKIDALVPLTNLSGTFQLENQSVRLLEGNAYLGNQELNMGSALIPYRKPNALVYFKTISDFDINQFIPYLSLTGIVPVGGTASIAIPIDISEKGVAPASVTLKVNNVTLRQVEGKEDILGLFKQDNAGYMLRTGQIILDKEGLLQVDFDGWLLPSKKREPFAQKDISLVHPLFKAGKVSPAPARIQNRQRDFLKMVN